MSCHIFFGKISSWPIWQPVNGRTELKEKHKDNNREHLQIIMSHSKRSGESGWDSPSPT
jgi:hypothetical protein